MNDPDRSAHIEAVQLHFLRNYVLADQAVDTNDVELYLPPAPGGSGGLHPLWTAYRNRAVPAAIWY
ncbi:hypothetical protein L21SP2_2498 [Salinispira pacifica]|uniref:Uncharacterized protein n=1 Tax=Salinispira pacifica TaxID=1307761 RepID=V5WKY1_9SPIO|nr:hypothetical protein L21SP2_2498 [Salinispira pacifica]